MMMFSANIMIDGIGDLKTTADYKYEKNRENAEETLTDTGIPMRYLDHFKGHENARQNAIVNETYNMIVTNHIEILDSNQGKVAILGGITIKLENSEDLFLPLKFTVLGEDRLKLFGNLSLDPKGCIDFVFLQEKLQAEMPWVLEGKDEKWDKKCVYEGKHSRLTKAASDVLFKARFTEKDFSNHEIFNDDQQSQEDILKKLFD